jgi:hypothetical protein
VALAFIAIFLLTDIRMWVERSSGLGADSAFQAILGAFTLRYSFHGSDVLVMYTMMLAAAPAIIYLFYRGHTGLTLVLSVVVWSLCQRFPSGANFPWIVANSSFPVAAWQLLFTVGMAAGYHREKVTGWLTRSVGSSGLVMLGSGSLFYLLLRSEQMMGDVRIPLGFLGDPTYASLFSKAELAPARVVAFLAIAVFTYTALSSLWAPINASLGWLIIPLGQNSLYVYIVHLFVVVGIYNGVALLFQQAPNVLFFTDANGINTAAQLICLSAVWFMVRSKFLFSVVPR